MKSSGFRLLLSILFIICFCCTFTSTSAAQDTEKSSQSEVDGRWQAETTIPAMGGSRDVPATVRLNLKAADSREVAGKMNMLIKLSQMRMTAAEDVSRDFDLQGKYEHPHLTLKTFSDSGQPAFKLEGDLTAAGDTLKLRSTSLKGDNSAEKEGKMLTFTRQNSE